MNKINSFFICLSCFFISTIGLSGNPTDGITSILIFNSDPDLSNWGFRRFSINMEGESAKKSSTSSQYKRDFCESSNEFFFTENERLAFVEIRNIIWDFINKNGKKGSEYPVLMILQDSSGDTFSYSMSNRSYLYLVQTLNEKLYLSGTADVKQLRVLMRFNMNWLAIPAARDFIDG